MRSNPIMPDPRVEKEARALSRAGYKVHVLGWDRSGTLPVIEQRSYATIERIRLRAMFGSGIRNLPHLLRWQARLTCWLWLHRQEYDIIHACDFDTVLPALVAKWFLGKRVVYDIFDFYADMLRRTPNILRQVIRRVDCWVIGRVDGVILADENRKEQIKGACPKVVEYIYNSPEPINTSEYEVTSRSGPGLHVVYVGLLQVERGLMQVLKVMQRYPEWSLDLAGFGGDEQRILEIARSLNNVRFHGRIPYETALNLSARADILFATYDPAVPNHRWSSPNKLFEAMMLGKPIIVARGTGTDRLVEQYGLGFVVDYGDSEQLEAVMRRVAAWSLEEKHRFAEHSRAIYREFFAWEKMEARLIRLYGRVAALTSVPAPD